jgi:hypothetical protein
VHREEPGHVRNEGADDQVHQALCQFGGARDPGASHPDAGDCPHSQQRGSPHQKNMIIHICISVDDIE